MISRATLFAVSLFVPALLIAAPATAQVWDTASLSDESTLEFLTDCPDEGPHWSPVWLVEVDGSLWVRLGKKAADRFDCSATRPYAAIRIAGQEYPRVEMRNEPELTEDVDRAMRAKYRTDFLIGWFATHRYIMRLVPAES